MEGIKSWDYNPAATVGEQGSTDHHFLCFCFLPVLHSHADPPLWAPGLHSRNRYAPPSPPLTGLIPAAYSLLSPAGLQQSCLSPAQVDPFYSQGESLSSEDQLDQTWVTVFGYSGLLTPPSSPGSSRVSCNTSFQLLVTLRRERIPHVCIC